MVLRILRVTLVLAVFLVALQLVSGDSPQAMAAGRQRTAPNLFYNYWVPPGPCGGPGAQLYICPVPTPPVVGHTYYTYQPLMPHEFLYRHSRTYYRYHPDGRVTRTAVTWQ